MKLSWWRSVFKQNHFVFKLGISILFLGFGFRLLFSQSSSVIPNFPDHNNDNININVNTPLEEKKARQIPSDFAQSPKELIQFHPKDNESERCDLFDGEWILNSGSPAYTNNSCRWIEDHQNCMRNGRPDTGYIYWKWSPKACELPRFDAKKFLEMMRDKSWAFVGDSITRNHLQSFVCLLSEVEDAVELFHDKDYKHRIWHFPTYNLTVSVYWSPFLARADTFEDVNGISSSEIKLHIDILDKTWTDLFNTWDYVIFSSGKWFIKTAIYFENDTPLGCHNCKGSNYTHLEFNFAYRRILKNLFKFVLDSRHKGTVFYRTSTPDHFENGEWSSGGTCNRTVPAKEGEFELSDLNRILREVELEEFEKAETEALEKGVDLKLVDVTRMSLVRPDGHPGPYRQFYPFAKVGDVKVQYDCLHWCLPGPIDSWNDLLMNLVGRMD